MDASPAFFTLLSLLAVDLLAILSPGPSILLVSQTAVERSRWQAIVVGCGITAGSVFRATLALSGLSVLFALVPLLQTATRLPAQHISPTSASGCGARRRRRPVRRAQPSRMPHLAPCCAA